MWRLVGVTWRAAIGALAAHDTDVAPTALAAHIATFTTSLDALRAMEVNIYTTIFDGVLGRLLIAAGQLEAARERLDIGLALAEDTGMCFYDAELLRLRAQTDGDAAARQAEINRALELGRR
jgi:predicted ATPase